MKKRVRTVRVETDAPDEEEATPVERITALMHMASHNEYQLAYQRGLITEAELTLLLHKALATLAAYK